jgi:DNA repair photolyase
MRKITVKTILSTVKNAPDWVFGLHYNMNLYRGCQHGCIYCDSRSKCYQLGELSDIRMKENALLLLDQELKSKRKKGTIGFGSMNDPYMQVEEEQRLTRGALKLIARHKFPIHIKTKSTLVCRDIDLLQEISQVYAAVSITITTIDDALSKKIEPYAPSSSERFEAINKLSQAGIYCGICLMPVLPFITDTQDNIVQILNRVKQCGASYVIGFMGMTLREGQREYYYHELDKQFPGFKEKYIARYQSVYEAPVPNHKELEAQFFNTCQSLGLKTKIDFYKPVVPTQMKIF